MARKRKWRYFACDFETTVFDNQEFTEVWSSAFCELFDESETVTIHNCIDDTFNYFMNNTDNVILYYHNLKFDGAFWLWYIMHKTDLKPAININHLSDGFVEDSKMQNNTYSYLIKNRHNTPITIANSENKDRPIVLKYGKCLLSAHSFGFSGLINMV